ncbi:MAG: hypothetical protein AABX70_00945 [Nanoarchaeota archaeon]
MVKFPEAEARIIKNIFICRGCKSKVRAQNLRVIKGEIRCRKCRSRALRTIRKK